MPATKRERDWVPIIIQTLSIMLLIIGFAIANEHRITVVEQSEKYTIKELRDVSEVVGMLQQNQVVIQQNQARLLALMDTMERRQNSSGGD